MTTFRPPLKAGRMALGSMTCRGQWHGVGKGGEREPERGGEWTGGTGVTGNKQGTDTGESGGGEEANGGRMKKGARWWGAFKRTGGSTKEEVPIRFGTYNIRNGRNGGLESALRGMSQPNMDMGIFQETKCTDGIYTRESAGYRVVATQFAKPTPRRSGTILQAVATFRGGGRPGVRAQRLELRGRDGSAAVVHHHILPRPCRT